MMSVAKSKNMTALKANEAILSYEEVKPQDYKRVEGKSQQIKAIYYSLPNL